MHTKSFFLSSLAGTVVYFLLGWLFYGILFTSLYPPTETENMLFVFLGCLTFSFFVGYIFSVWAGISTLMTGAKAGAIIGLFYGLSMNFFMYSSKELNINHMLTDVVINILMTAITGGVIGLVIGVSKK